MNQTPSILILSLQGSSQKADSTAEYTKGVQEHPDQMELVKLICCRDTKTKANQLLKKQIRQAPVT